MYSDIKNNEFMYKPINYNMNPVSNYSMMKDFKKSSQIEEKINHIYDTSLKKFEGADLGKTLEKFTDDGTEYPERLNKILGIFLDKFLEVLDAHTTEKMNKKNVKEILEQGYSYIDLSRSGSFPSTKVALTKILPEVLLELHKDSKKKAENIKFKSNEILNNILKKFLGNVEESGKDALKKIFPNPAPLMEEDKEIKNKFFNTALEIYGSLRKNREKFKNGLEGRFINTLSEKIDSLLSYFFYTSNYKYYKNKREYERIFNQFMTINFYPNFRETDVEVLKYYIDNNVEEGKLKFDTKSRFLKEKGRELCYLYSEELRKIEDIKRKNIILGRNDVLEIELEKLNYIKNMMQYAIFRLKDEKNEDVCKLEYKMAQIKFSLRADIELMKKLCKIRESLISQGLSKDKKFEMVGKMNAILGYKILDGVSFILSKIFEEYCELDQSVAEYTKCQEHTYSGGLVAKINQEEKHITYFLNSFKEQSVSSAREKGVAEEFDFWDTMDEFFASNKIEIFKPKEDVRLITRGNKTKIKNLEKKVSDNLTKFIGQQNNAIERHYKDLIKYKYPPKYIKPENEYSDRGVIRQGKLNQNMNMPKIFKSYKMTIPFEDDMNKLGIEEKEEDLKKLEEKLIKEKIKTYNNSVVTSMKKIRGELPKKIRSLQSQKKESIRDCAGEYKRILGEIEGNLRLTKKNYGNFYDKKINYYTAINSEKIKNIKNSENNKFKLMDKEKSGHEQILNFKQQCEEIEIKNETLNKKIEERSKAAQKYREKIEEFMSNNDKKNIRRGVDDEQAKEKKFIKYSAIDYMLRKRTGVLGLQPTIRYLLEKDGLVIINNEEERTKQEILNLSKEKEDNDAEIKKLRDDNVLLQKSLREGKFELTRQENFNKERKIAKEIEESNKRILSEYDRYKVSCEGLKNSTIELKQAEDLLNKTVEIMKQYENDKGSQQYQNALNNFSRQSNAVNSSKESVQRFVGEIKNVWSNLGQLVAQRDTKITTYNQLFKNRIEAYFKTKEINFRTKINDLNIKKLEEQNKSNDFKKKIKEFYSKVYAKIKDILGKEKYQDFKGKTQQEKETIIKEFQDENEENKPVLSVLEGLFKCLEELEEQNLDSTEKDIKSKSKEVEDLVKKIDDSIQKIKLEEKEYNDKSTKEKEEFDKQIKEIKKRHTLEIEALRNELASSNSNRDKKIKEYSTNFVNERRKVFTKDNEKMKTIIEAQLENLKLDGFVDSKSKGKPKRSPEIQKYINSLQQDLNKKIEDKMSIKEQLERRLVFEKEKYQKLFYEGCALNLDFEKNRMFIEGEKGYAGRLLLNKFDPDMESYNDDLHKSAIEVLQISKKGKTDIENLVFPIDQLGINNPMMQDLKEIDGEYDKFYDKIRERYKEIEESQSQKLLESTDKEKDLESQQENLTETIKNVQLQKYETKKKIIEIIQDINLVQEEILKFKIQRDAIPALVEHGLVKRKYEEKIKKLESQLDVLKKSRKEFFEEKGRIEKNIEKYNRSSTEDSEMVLLLSNEKNQRKVEISELEQSYSEAIRKITEYKNKLDETIKVREGLLEFIKEEEEKGEAKDQNLIGELNSKIERCESLIGQLEFQLSDEEKKAEDISSLREQMREKLEGIESKISELDQQSLSCKEYNNELRRKLAYISKKIKHIADRIDEIETEKQNINYLYCGEYGRNFEIEMETYRQGEKEYSEEIDSFNKKVHNDEESYKTCREDFVNKANQAQNELGVQDKEKHMYLQSAAEFSLRKSAAQSYIESMKTSLQSIIQQFKQTLTERRDKIIELNDKMKDLPEQEQPQGEQPQGEQPQGEQPQGNNEEPRNWENQKQYFLRVVQPAINGFNEELNRWRNCILEIEVKITKYYNDFLGKNTNQFVEFLGGMGRVDSKEKFVRSFQEQNRRNIERAYIEQQEMIGLFKEEGKRLSELKKSYREQVLKQNKNYTTIKEEIENLEDQKQGKEKMKFNNLVTFFDSAAQIDYCNDLLKKEKIKFEDEFYKNTDDNGKKFEEEDNKNFELFEALSNQTLGEENCKKFTEMQYKEKLLDKENKCKSAEEEFSNAEEIFSELQGIEEGLDKSIKENITKFEQNKYPNAEKKKKEDKDYLLSEVLTEIKNEINRQTKVAEKEKQEYQNKYENNQLPQYEDYEKRHTEELESEIKKFEGITKLFNSEKLSVENTFPSRIESRKKQYLELILGEQAKIGRLNFKEENAKFKSITSNQQNMKQMEDEYLQTEAELNGLQSKIEKLRLFCAGDLDFYCRDIEEKIKEKGEIYEENKEKLEEFKKAIDEEVKKETQFSQAVEGQLAVLRAEVQRCATQVTDSVENVLQGIENFLFEFFKEILDASNLAGEPKKIDVKKNIYDLFFNDQDYMSKKYDENSNVSLDEVAEERAKEFINAIPVDAKSVDEKFKKCQFIQEKLKGIRDSYELSIALNNTAGEGEEEFAEQHLQKLEKLLEEINNLSEAQCLIQFKEEYDEKQELLEKQKRRVEEEIIKARRNTDKRYKGFNEVEGLLYEKSKILDDLKGKIFPDSKTETEIAIAGYKDDQKDIDKEIMEIDL